MTWIGRDCDVTGIICLDHWSDRSEFMTWIGRDCDSEFRHRRQFLPYYQNLWPELEGIVTFTPSATISPTFSKQSEFMTWIGRDCDTPPMTPPMAVPASIRIYDLNWKGLWHLRIGGSAIGRIIQSEFMTWIGRDCDFSYVGDPSLFCVHQNLWPELEGIVTTLQRFDVDVDVFIRIYDLNWKGLWRYEVFHSASSTQCRSEFMTWIGRDCDHDSFAWDKMLSASSEFMTWIGRDCDSSGSFSSALLLSIRIYDLNWKGLWLRSCLGSVLDRVIRIYDLNWKGLWLPGRCRDDILSVVHQNLWPELEGIVTERAGFWGNLFVQSEFMTWIGRDCDRQDQARSVFTPDDPIRIYDLNWKGLWLSEAGEIPATVWRDQNLWPELEGIVTATSPLPRVST